MLKQFKNYNTCSDMFRFTPEPSSGSSPVLSLVHWWTARLHNRLLCRHNTECVYTDEHRKTMLCSFS